MTDFSKMTDKEMFDHDSAIFNDWLKFNTDHKDQFLVVLNSGRGDGLVFKKNILPRLKEKHSNIVLAVCYPEMFPNEKTISIAEAERMCDTSKYDVYRMGVETNHQGSLTSLFERMYL
jgi:hypothetical protein